MPRSKQAKYNTMGDDKQLKSEQDEINLIEILKEMRKDMNENSNKIALRLDKVEQFIYKELETLKLEIKSLKKENETLKKTCLELKNENQNAYGQIDKIEGDMHEMQQYSRNRNIEIVGIPLTEKEDILKVTEKLASVLNVTYETKDISAVHRLPSRNGKNPNIVVQFVSRFKRQEWLVASKGRKLNAKQLSTHLKDSNIYVNEHLTPYNKTLLGRARGLRKESVVDFVWCKEGKIFVRKKDGDKAVLIKRMEDLEQFNR